MLNPKEEQKYKRLKELAQELHLPIPEAFIELEVFDKDGKLIQRHRQRSHSWVRNAYNCLFVQLAGKGMTADGFGAGKISVKDTGGTVRDTDGWVIGISSFDVDALGECYREHAAHVAHGILVGSGVNAEDFEDYVLQTPIAEGTGAGELNHVASEENAYSYASLVGTNTLVRYFNNNSGGNVSVNEVCLACHGIYGGTTLDFITSRDKLASTVTVPDTGQLKVTYTIQLVFPE